MKIWIIADTHFYHENIKKFQGRPDDFNEQIIKNWNRLVQYNDLVIHLGDVIFGLNKEEQLPCLMATLPGKKILCRGNHDPKSATWYMERGFDFVCDYFIYQDIAFSHAPLTPLPPQSLVADMRLVNWNIHGHFHSGQSKEPRETSKQRPYKDRYYNSEYYKTHKEKYILMHIDETLTPIALDEKLKEVFYSKNDLPEKG